MDFRVPPNGVSQAVNLWRAIPLDLSGIDTEGRPACRRPARGEQANVAIRLACPSRKYPKFEYAPVPLGVTTFSGL
jgi:hypothetical protein